MAGEDIIMLRDARGERPYIFPFGYRANGDALKFLREPRRWPVRMDISHWRHTFLSF
jgi:hypothetical protein